MNINPVDGQLSIYAVSKFKNDHQEAVYIADARYTQDLITRLALEYNGGVGADILIIPSGTFKDAKPSHSFVQAADNLFSTATSDTWINVMHDLETLLRNSI